MIQSVLTQVVSNVILAQANDQGTDGRTEVASQSAQNHHDDRRQENSLSHVRTHRADVGAIHCAAKSGQRRPQGKNTEENETDIDSQGTYHDRILNTGANDQSDPGVAQESPNTD